MILFADDALLSGKGRVCEPAHMRHSDPGDLPGLAETAAEREGTDAGRVCRGVKQDIHVPGASGAGGVGLCYRRDLTS